MEDDMKDVLEYVLQFEASEMATRDARAHSELCRDYFDGKQLTDKEMRTLNARGQPPVVFNEIKPKVKTMTGLEKQTRRDPKALPRNPDDDDAAQAATDAIRFVCDASKWDDKRSRCANELAVEGTCAVMVGTKERKGGLDPDIRRVAWDRFYYDAHSSELDFSDAAYMGEVVWMDLTEAIAKFPDARDVLESTWMQARDDQTYDDKPKFNLWADYKRKRVRLCEHYHNDGDGWEFCIFTRAGFVVEPNKSPYLDDDGKPENPICAVSLYIDRENSRYGEVKAMIDPQDEINKRRSKALHLISMRQVRVSPAAGMDAKAIRDELARPDGVFVGERDDVEILGTSDMAMGNLNLLQDAREHIHRTGANNALAGKDTSSQSGKAIIAQQQGGMVESSDFLDTLRVLSYGVYRKVWSRIKQHWQGERWVRVTDNDNNVKFVGLNRPVTVLQTVAKKMGVTKDNIAKQPPEVVQKLQLVASDPRAHQVVGQENNVTEMDVDIIISDGIDTPTVQAEQFDTLAKMLPAFGQFGQTPAMLKLLVNASQLRDKDKLLEILDEMSGGQQQQDPQAAMQAQLQGQMQIEQQKAEFEGNIEIEKAKIGAMADIEVAKIKAGTESHIKARQIETDVALSERKALLEHHAKARVDEATGVAAERRGAADMNANQIAVLSQLAEAVAAMAQPKAKIPIRDENGLLIGVREEPIQQEQAA